MLLCDRKAVYVWRKLFERRKILCCQTVMLGSTSICKRCLERVTYIWGQTRCVLLDGNRASLLKTLQSLVDLSSQESITVMVFSAVKRQVLQCQILLILLLLLLLITLIYNNIILFITRPAAILPGQENNNFKINVKMYCCSVYVKLHLHDLFLCL